MKTFSVLLALCAGNSSVTSEFPSQGQWRGALICDWINVWVNNHEGGDLRRRLAHYDVTVMPYTWWYQAITRTNVDSASKVFCGTHLGVIQKKCPWTIIHNTCLKKTHLKLVPHTRGQLVKSSVLRDDGDITDNIFYNIFLNCNIWKWQNV